MIALSWKIGAVLVAAAALATAGVIYYHHIDQQGYDRAVSDRAKQDLVAVVGRITENAAIGVKQDALNVFLTKAKDEELAPVRARIAVAPSLRPGAGLCGSAPTSKAEDASSGDGANPPGRLVRSDVDRDLRALKLAVEEDLATGRTCQAWGKENGFIP